MITMNRRRDTELQTEIFGCFPQMRPFRAKDGKSDDVCCACNAGAW